MTITKIPALQPVTSSAISDIGYSPDIQTLFIRFPSGNVYSYPEVSNDLWAQFQAAESKGKFYGQAIKGKFTGSPVKQDEAEDTEGATAD
jgi:hypothetical protein